MIKFRFLVFLQAGHDGGTLKSVYSEAVLANAHGGGYARLLLR
jgi:hypothetical protein